MALECKELAEISIPYEHQNNGFIAGLSSFIDAFEKKLNNNYEFVYSTSDVEGYSWGGRRSGHDHTKQELSFDRVTIHIGALGHSGEESEHLTYNTTPDDIYSLRNSLIMMQEDGVNEPHSSKVRFEKVKSYGLSSERPSPYSVNCDIEWVNRNGDFTSVSLNSGRNKFLCTDDKTNLKIKISSKSPEKMDDSDLAVLDAVLDYADEIGTVTYHDVLLEQHRNKK